MWSWSAASPCCRSTWRGNKALPFHIWYPSLLGLAVGFVFMNMPPVADQFMALYQTGHAGLAFCLSGLLWSHALMQIPAGLAVDRLGAKKTLFLAIAVGAAANLVPFLAPASLRLAFAARFLLGCGTALFIIIGAKMVGVLAPPSRAAAAQGIFGGTFGAGTMLPYLMLSWLGDCAWRYSYIFGFLFFIALLPGAFMLPRNPRLESNAENNGLAGIGRTLRLVLPVRAVWVLGLMHAFSFATLNNLGQWLPSMLADLSGTDIAVWTLATTFVLLIGSLSRMLSGTALKFVSRAAAINGVLAVVVLFYLCLGLSPWPYATLAAGLVLALLCGLNFGSLFTMGGLAVPPEAMATSLALLNMLANIGSVCVTLLMGNVREYAGRFQPALLLVAALAAAALIAFRKYIRKLDAGLARHDERI